MPLSDYNINNRGWIRAGNCDWQITTKKGSDDKDKYYIKKFRDPKYPKEGIDDYDELKDKAENWFNNLNDIFKAVSKNCRATGNLVIPVEFVRDRYSYYKITRKVDVEKGIPVNEISKLSIEERLLLLKLMSSALKHLHDLKIVHGDLKTDNILITKGGLNKYICKIIDFDDSFYEGKPGNSAPGTPEYYSPEVVMYNIGIGNVGERVPDKSYKEKITCKSDIFALGLIFHEYLTGKPIEHDGYGSIGGKVLSEVLTLESDRKKLPQYLSELLQSMVQKDYTKRPSIDQVLQVLRNELPKPEKYAIKTPNGNYALYDEKGKRVKSVPESIYLEKYQKEYLLKKNGETDPNPPKHGKYAVITPNGNYTLYDENDKRVKSVPKTIYEDTYQKEYPVRK